mgnify:CR=1 FL=1
MKLVSPGGTVVDVHPSKIESMLASGWKEPEAEKKVKKSATTESK